MQGSSGAAHLEHTLQSEISFSGVGLHSRRHGVDAAGSGCGRVGHRFSADRSGQLRDSGERAERGQGQLCDIADAPVGADPTTEHLLSALIGCGVDNVIVEVDNLEVPILDGSALPYVQAFQATGLKPQRRRREYLRILKEVEVREGSKFIGVYPRGGRGLRDRLHDRLPCADRA